MINDLKQLSYLILSYQEYTTKMQKKRLKNNEKEDNYDVIH